MADFSRFGIYAAQIGDLLFQDIKSTSFRSASRKSVPIPGGAIHPSAVINCASDPVIGFTTCNLDAAFGSSPSVSVWEGYKVDTVGVPTAATLIQFQKRNFGGSFIPTGTAQHAVGTSTRGILIPRSLSVAIDDEQGAQAAFEYMPLSTTGILEPVTWSTASALTSSALFGGLWYLGPVRRGLLGSSLSDMAGLINLEINFGIDFRSPRADGCIYAVNGSTYSVVPEIRATFLDPAQRTDTLGSPWGYKYVSAPHGWNFHLRKGAEGGGRVADATTQHVVFTTTTGDNTTDEVTVSQLDDVTTQIILRPTAGITVSTGVAIT